MPSEYRSTITAALPPTLIDVVQESRACQPLGTATRADLVRRLAIALLAVVLAVTLTYPLAFKLDRAGRINTGDGQFSLWCVSWVAHALTTAPMSLFDANIYYPHHNTLAYSEANIVAGALGVPAFLASHGNPYTTHNSVVLMAFAFSFLAAYGLARYITGSTVGAIAAGIAFAYCPYIFARTAHIQLLMTFGLPLSMLAWHRLVDRPSIGRAWQLALALAVQGLACAYYGVFAGLMVGLGTVYYATVRRQWFTGRHWRLIGLAAAAAALIVLPFFLPFVELQKNFGFVRTLDEASMYSADWQAWLASSAHAHAWLRASVGHWNEVLFPGVLTVGFGVAGAAMGLGRRSGPSVDEEPLRMRAGFGGNRRRETTVFYQVVGIAAFWASFGPSAGLYEGLYRLLPVFSFLRAPARFGIVLALVLSVFVAMAIAHVISGRTRRAQWVLAGIVVALLACELATAPLVLPEAEPIDQAYRLLAQLPRGPVLELPFYDQRQDYRRHAEYMLNSTWHWQPLINGYSDYIPEDFRQIATPLNSFPSPEAFRLLRRRRARYVLLHPRGFDHRVLAQISERLPTYADHLRLLSKTDSVWLYEIVQWPAGP